ncbi:MAG: EscJ/YscJ/HrcJ family type III secretion inner membrane ring protein, partial [Pseudomonadota bacterium]
MIVRLKLLTVLIVAGLLAGCGRVDLYTGLTEQQSNEVAAALIAAGISAEKTRASDKKGWAVRVPQASMPHAMSVLKAAGLPSSEYASLGELFERKGFVSSPLEEKARYLHGLSQELAHTLKQLEGVVVARVHIALPEQDVLSDEHHRRRRWPQLV